MFLLFKLGALSMRPLSGIMLWYLGELDELGPTFAFFSRWRPEELKPIDFNAYEIILLSLSEKGFFVNCKIPINELFGENEYSKIVSAGQLEELISVRFRLAIEWKNKLDYQFTDEPMIEEYGNIEGFKYYTFPFVILNNEGWYGK
jgi:hypothetical protein